MNAHSCDADWYLEVRAVAYVLSQSGLLHHSIPGTQVGLSCWETRDSEDIIKSGRGC